MKEIKLFDYQEDMKERIEKALRLHRSVMAQMPTGTGKTVLLASVVESFLREHSNCNVWIVAHRRELVSQIRETIQRVFSKTPSLLYKDFSNHPVNSSKITPSLFTLKEGNFSKTHPSSLTLKGGSTAFPKPLSPQGTGDVTAPPRRSEPFRSKVGGPSKVSPDCAGWDRRDAIGDMTSATAATSTDTSATAARSSFAANSSAAIDRVQKELNELGLWKFAGGIMYIMQEVFGMPASRLIVPPNEKYGRFVLNEVLEAGNFGKHDARNRFGRSKLGHNLQRVYRDIRLVRYFPAEALCEPLFRIWHFFWRLKHRRQSLGVFS